MKIAGSVFALCIPVLMAGFIGYELAGPVAARDFTILYSLDRKQNDRALVDVIDRAQKYVYFAIYEFTKQNIADALMRAKGRGLVVAGIMDAGQSEDAAQARIAAALTGTGIAVEFQKHPKGIMHLKLLVTDGAYALGSYNWTESATVLNDEVLEIGTAESLRKEYLGIMEQVLATNQ